MNLTAVYIKVPEGYVAFVEELPGVIYARLNDDEARENLTEAVDLIREANRQLAERWIAGQTVTREPFALRAS